MSGGGGGGGKAVIGMAAMIMIPVAAPLIAESMMGSAFVAGSMSAIGTSAAVGGVMGAATSHALYGNTKGFWGGALGGAASGYSYEGSPQYQAAASDAGSGLGNGVATPAAGLDTSAAPAAATKAATPMQSAVGGVAPEANYGDMYGSPGATQQVGLTGGGTNSAVNVNGAPSNTAINPNDWSPVGYDNPNTYGQVTSQAPGSGVTANGGGIGSTASSEKPGLGTRLKEAGGKAWDAATDPNNLVRAGINAGAIGLANKINQPDMSGMDSYMNDVKNMNQQAMDFNMGQANKKSAIGDRLVSTADNINPEYYGAKSQGASMTRDAAGWDQEEQRLRASGAGQAQINSLRRKQQIGASQNAGTAFDSGYGQGTAARVQTLGAAGQSYSGINQPNAGDMAAAYASLYGTKRKMASDTGQMINDVFNYKDPTKKNLPIDQTSNGTSGP